MCLKDNFLHNPMIRGRNGEMVRKSSNNADILEKIQLYKAQPMNVIMQRIIEGYEAEDRGSKRKGYKITPWRVHGGEKTDKSFREPFKHGGISKNRNAHPQQGQPKIPPCIKCGRFHSPTIDECLLFDHPTAGKDPTWPAGKKALILETPQLWAEWLTAKEKTHPELVKKYKEKMDERRSNNGGQGNRGGGGKPPRYPNNKGGNNNTNRMNKRNYLAFNGVFIDDVGANTSDVAQHGHDVATTECSSETEHASPRVTLEQISEECFFAVGRFKKQRAANGKKLPSTRRDKAIRCYMDPGAQANFISATALEKVFIIDSSEEIECQITQNENPMGDVCRRCVRVQFKLDLLRKAEIKHTEWFIVSEDLNYDAVIGTKFCRENGYTSFHAKLKPWSRHVAERSAEEETASPKKSEEEKAEARDAFINATQQHELSDEEIKVKQAEFDVAMQHVPAEMFEKHGSIHPVTHRPLIRNPNVEGPKHVEHRGAHATMQNLNRMTQECKAILAQVNHQRHCKTVQVLSENRKAQERFWSADEVETALKAEKQAALDAEKNFRDNESYLQPKHVYVPAKKHARFYEPVSFNAYAAESTSVASKATPTAESHQLFVNNQMVVIKGLENHTELNGVPARIIQFDEEKQLYSISVSKPRGYWLIAEKYLQPAVILKQGKGDIGPKELGIDPESGQPSLDPLARPIHRQYGNYVSKELTARIALVLEKYKKVFSEDVSEPCTFTSMKIKLKPNAILPRSARLWKNSPLIRAEIRRQLQQMIDMKIVTKSDSAIVSNVLMVKRPGMPGKYRFTVDFRAINDATEGEQWQMPDVQDQLSRLKGKSIFGCVDASSYYHQIGLRLCVNWHFE
jgi:hypothetical protein